MDKYDCHRLISNLSPLVPFSPPLCDSQIKSMFAATRYLATLVYLGTMTLTLIFAFSESIPGRGVLLILCIVTQFLAMAYYVLRYVYIYMYIYIYVLYIYIYVCCIFLAPSDSILCRVLSVCAATSRSRARWCGSGVGRAAGWARTRGYRTHMRR